MKKKYKRFIFFRTIRFVLYYYYEEMRGVKKRSRFSPNNNFYCSFRVFFSKFSNKNYVCSEIRHHGNQIKLLIQ